MLDLQEAQQKILTAVDVQQNVESVPLSQSRGRILAEAVFAPVAVPPHKNSAMDGYAIAADSSIRSRMCL